jgi:hypothetical protein
MPNTTSNPYALLNEKNQMFWERENELLAQRMQDLTLFQVVMRDMTSEELRGVPLRNRKSTAQAFADVAGTWTHVEEGTKRRYRFEFARKGGRAPKADGLQLFIVAKVCAMPKLTVRGLLSILANHRDFEVVDGCIAFDKGNGAEKLVPVRALKDRLCRAKKKMHSR